MAETANSPSPVETVATEEEQTQKSERPALAGPHVLRLFQQPPGTVRLTIDLGEPWGGYSYPTIRLYQAAPLSLPGQYLSLVNGKGEEIYQVRRLTDLPKEQQPLAEEELRRRYLTAVVKAVTDVRTEFGITYWNVVTDKGERDFVVQSLSESCVWLSDTHLLLIDVDGNRFEIPNREALDADSKAHLSTVL